MCRCLYKNDKRRSAIRKDGKKLNIPRYGHLSFDALGKLEKMVCGLSHIEHAGELCDSYLA